MLMPWTHLSVRNISLVPEINELMILTKQTEVTLNISQIISKLEDSSHSQGFPAHISARWSRLPKALSLLIQSPFTLRPNLMLISYEAYSHMESMQEAAGGHGMENDKTGCPSSFSLSTGPKSILLTAWDFLQPQVLSKSNQLSAGLRCSVPLMTEFVVRQRCNAAFLIRCFPIDPLNILIIWCIRNITLL